MSKIFEKNCGNCGAVYCPMGCGDSEDRYPGWESKTCSNPPGKEMKYDQGKVDMSFLEYFPNALEALCRVSEAGCKKYERGSFTQVKNARRRYTGAMLRHYFQEGSGDEPEIDEETGLEHDLMTMWNAICRVELRLLGMKLDEL